MEQDDHRTGGLLHDLLDQVERVFGALAESDKRDVRPLPGGDGPDVLDIDLACDHLVPECGDDRRYRHKVIRSFVRDQYAQMFGFPMGHYAPSPGEGVCTRSPAPSMRLATQDCERNAPLKRAGHASTLASA